MQRRWARLLVLIPFCLGCDALTVRTYAGTIVQMSWVGSTPTADGHHLELWTRDQYNDIIRVDAHFTYEDLKTKDTKTITTRGLQVRLALPLEDPCLIDAKGNLLTTADAYSSSTNVKGVIQTPADQAQQVVNRIKQALSMADGGIEMISLYVVVPYDPTPVPVIPPGTAAADRLAMCHAYWDASPLTYTGNPAQPTAPLHGGSYGFVAFTTQSPAQGYDGIRLDSPTSLKGTQEIWITDETDTLEQVGINASMGLFPGTIYLQSTPTAGGREVLHFDLTGPTASGTAALEVNLDDDSVLF